MLRIKNEWEKKCNEIEEQNKEEIVKKLKKIKKKKN